MGNYPLLKNVLPHLSNKIKDYFISKSRLDLANQVNILRVKELCDCGEPDCGSFYLTQYVVNENELEGFGFEGVGTIEVFEGKIGFIEIFPSNLGFEIRSAICEDILTRNKFLLRGVHSGNGNINICA